jgi:hypothetical protein
MVFEMSGRGLRPGPPWTSGGFDRPSFSDRDDFFIQLPPAGSIYDSLFLGLRRQQVPSICRHVLLRSWPAQSIDWTMPDQMPERNLSAGKRI